MYYIQNIVSSIKFKSIRSAGTAEAIGIMGIRNINGISLFLEHGDKDISLGIHYFIILGA